MPRPKDAKGGDGSQRGSFVPFYEDSAQIYMSLKLSKDGLSREEDTDVLKGMYDENGNVRNVGWKVRRKVFGDDDGPRPGAE